VAMRNINHEDVTEAALRPMGPPGRGFWILAGLLALPVAIGAAAYVYQLINGLGVTGLSDEVFWGVYTSNLVTFIGFSYGGAVVSAILRITHAQWRSPITRLAEATALVTLLIGASFAIIHLGHPERIWRFFIYSRVSSPIVWDSIAISTYLVGTVIFLYILLIPDLAVVRDRVDAKVGSLTRRLSKLLAFGWRGLPEQRQRLQWGITVMSILIIPLAVGVHSVLSWAFAVTSRTGWHSSIFGPYFVVAALFSGVATVILVVAGFRKGYHLERFIGEKQIRYLGYIMLTLGLLYLYFTFAEFLTEGYTSFEETVPVLEALLLDRYAPLFWFWVIATGILPMALVAVPTTRTVPGIVAAAALVVAGMWLKRFLIVVPTLASPLVTGGEWASYRPSWVEAEITIGAAAAIPLMLMFFFRLFPVLSILEMEETETIQP
jgi:Ni/Fe-hydrogenase subunit HybB-like protein